MGDFTRVKSPMNFHGGFYPSGNTLDYKMTHWLFTLFQIISNILTSSLLTFSVIYTFYFYIASEGLKIYQKYLIKKVPDFPEIWSFFMSSSFWKAVCLVEVSSIYRCFIILLKDTFNFWIFSAKVSLSLINCCPACSASLVLATTSPSAFTQPRTQSPTPVIKR